MVYETLVTAAGAFDDACEAAREELSGAVATRNKLTAALHPTPLPPEVETWCKQQYIDPCDSTVVVWTGEDPIFVCVRGVYGEPHGGGCTETVYARTRRGVAHGPRYDIMFLERCDSRRAVAVAWATLALCMPFKHVWSSGVSEGGEGIFDTNVTAWGFKSGNRAGVGGVVDLLRHSGIEFVCPFTSVSGNLSSRSLYAECFYEDTGECGGLLLHVTPDLTCIDDITCTCAAYYRMVVHAAPSPDYFKASESTSKIGTLYVLWEHGSETSATPNLLGTPKLSELVSRSDISDRVLGVWISKMPGTDAVSCFKGGLILTCICADVDPIVRVFVCGTLCPNPDGATPCQWLSVEAALTLGTTREPILKAVYGIMSKNTTLWSEAFEEDLTVSKINYGMVIPSTVVYSGQSHDGALSNARGFFDGCMKNFLHATDGQPRFVAPVDLHRNLKVQGEEVQRHVTLLILMAAMNDGTGAAKPRAQLMYMISNKSHSHVSLLGSMPLETTPSPLWSPPIRTIECVLDQISTCASALVGLY